MGKKVNLRSLAFLPIVLSLILTYLFFIDLPIHDYWGALQSLIAIRNADIKTHLAYYWEPFVDHRHLFPKMTIDLLSWLTDNQHYALEISLGFAARLIMLYLIWIFIRKSDLSEQNKTIAWLIGAASLFWPAQQIIFQHHWYSTTYGWSLTLGILAIYFLITFWGRWLGITGAALACAGSGYSLANGMSLWPAIGLSLLPQSSWSGRQKAVWWLTSLFAFGLFSLGLPSRAEQGFPPLQAILNSPIKGITFFLQTFAPPLRQFERPAVQVLAGLTTVIIGIWPILLLIKKKRLFTPTAFPWLVFVLWCLTMSVMVTVGRSTLGGQPSSLYYSALVLFQIGAVPLWLTLYPNIVPSKRRDWIRLPGLMGAAGFVFLAWIYMVGSKQGTVDVRSRQHQIKWAQSCLHYYPALDNHPLYLFPYEELGTFKEDILPYLAKNNALPHYVNLTPFTIVVPTRFEIQKIHDIEVLEEGPAQYQFITTGKESYIIFKPLPEIDKRHVISFSTESSAATDVGFYWNDGKGWSDRKSLTLDRKGVLITTNWGYFPEINRADAQRRVEAIGLSLVNVKVPATRLTVRDIKVLTR